MASIAEIADTLASFTLFSDLSRPQLEAVIHALDEEWYSEGQRVLRQGFTGGGFYVILDGEATVRIDGHDRVRLSQGDFFGEISILLDEPPVADVVAVGALRCLVLARTRSGRLAARPAHGGVPDAAGRGPEAAGGEQPALVTDRPFPPGSYPAVVIGSGPGGLQVATT